MSHEKGCRILKHVLKPYDNRGVVSVSYEVVCDKIVPCKWTFTGQKVKELASDVTAVCIVLWCRSRSLVCLKSVT